MVIIEYIRFRADGHIWYVNRTPTFQLGEGTKTVALICWKDWKSRGVRNRRKRGRETNDRDKWSSTKTG